MGSAPTSSPICRRPDRDSRDRSCRAMTWPRGFPDWASQSIVGPSSTWVSATDIRSAYVPSTGAGQSGCRVGGIDRRIIVAVLPVVPLRQITGLEVAGERDGRLRAGRDDQHTDNGYEDAAKFHAVSELGFVAYNRLPSSPGTANAPRSRQITCLCQNTDYMRRARHVGVDGVRRVPVEQQGQPLALELPRLVADLARVAQQEVQRRPRDRPLAGARLKAVGLAVAAVAADTARACRRRSRRTACCRGSCCSAARTRRGGAGRRASARAWQTTTAARRARS